MSLYYIDDSESDKREMVVDELLSSRRVMKDGRLRDKIILDCSADKHSAGHQVSGFDGAEIWAVLRRSCGAMGGSRKGCAAPILISGYYWRTRCYF
jgi:hypothetical protein